MAAICTAFMAFAPRIPQDPNYHHFAGSSPWSTPLTNLAFVAVGAWWLWKSPSVAAAGVFLTGFGSAYYHWWPDDARLVWERLPMTIVFMSVLAVVLEVWAGLRRWRWPLIAFGFASILWWQCIGDLRWYAAVQFGPLLVFLPAAFSEARVLGIWRGLAVYVVAKILENFDAPIYKAIGFSGHSMKHLVGALAAYWILLWIDTCYSHGRSRLSSLPRVCGDSERPGFSSLNTSGFPEAFANTTSWSAYSRLLYFNFEVGFRVLDIQSGDVIESGDSFPHSRLATRRDPIILPLG